jgi:hypothetical protein
MCLHTTQLSPQQDCSHVRKPLNAGATESQVKKEQALNGCNKIQLQRELLTNFQNKELERAAQCKYY